MNKFETSLSVNGNSQLQKRAKAVAEQTKLAMEQRVNDLKYKLSAKKQEMEEHGDLGPDQNTSTRPVDKDFDPKAWVEKTIRLAQEIELIKIELDIAAKAQVEWFEVGVEQKED
jgi:hypothetical protein